MEGGRESLRERLKEKEGGTERVREVPRERGWGKGGCREGR